MAYIPKDNIKYIIPIMNNRKSMTMLKILKGIAKAVMEFLILTAFSNTSSNDKV